jgi:hypothetical protein
MCKNFDEFLDLIRILITNCYFFIWEQFNFLIWMSFLIQESNDNLGEEGVLLLVLHENQQNLLTCSHKKPSEIR